MNKTTALATALLTASLVAVPAAAFAATPQDAVVANPNVAANSAAQHMTLRADKTTVAPYQRVNFTVNSTMTGNGILYQNGKPAPKVHPIKITAGQPTVFYYQPGMSGSYFVRIGNSLQSNTVVVNVR